MLCADKSDVLSYLCVCKERCPYIEILCVEQEGWIFLCHTCYFLMLDTNVIHLYACDKIFLLTLNVFKTFLLAVLFICVYLRRMLIKKQKTK
jgi:hypothetical protein